MWQGDSQLLLNMTTNHHVKGTCLAFGEVVLMLSRGMGLIS